MRRKSLLPDDPLLEAVRGIHDPRKGLRKHVENYMKQRADPQLQENDAKSVIVGEDLIKGNAQPLGVMLADGELPIREVGYIFAQTLDPDRTKDPQFPFQFYVYDSQGRPGPRSSSSREWKVPQTEDEWLVDCLENGDVGEVASVFRSGKAPGQSVLRMLGKMILGHSGLRYLLKYKNTVKGQVGGRKSIMKELERDTIGAVAQKLISTGATYKDVIYYVADAAPISKEAVRKHYAAFKKRRIRQA